MYYSMSLSRCYWLVSKEKKALKLNLKTTTFWFCRQFFLPQWLHPQCSTLCLPKIKFPFKYIPQFATNIFFCSKVTSHF